MHVAFCELIEKAKIQTLELNDKNIKRKWRTFLNSAQ